MKRKDSYDHVEIYPKSFAPKKPERSKQNNDLVRSGFADNKEKYVRALHALVSKYYYLLTGPLNIGLYRDDGLAVIKQSSGTSLEKIKKSLIKKYPQ